MAITFSNPPVVEVSLGQVFLQRQDLLVPHFGSFWERVKAKFPKVAHAPPIAESAGVVTSEEGYFLPRVWLSSTDDVYLIQLQQDRFHFNWRKTPDREYVRFPEILKRHQELLSEFKSFVEDATGASLQPVRNEMVYTNFITNDGCDSFQLAEAALRDSAWSGGARFLPQPKATSHTYLFDVPNERGRLTVSIASGSLGLGGAPILKADLLVRGDVAEHNQDFCEWATDARNFLVAAFKDLTTEVMHNKWGLQNDQ